MKKAISVLLLGILLLTMVSCGGTKADGTYYNETQKQTIELDGGKVTWTEMGFAFKGTYEVKGNEITLEVDGGGLLGDKIFSGKIESNDILLTGGSLSEEGELFVKK